MAVQLPVGEERVRSLPLAEALGIAPVILLLAVLLWLAFVSVAPNGEAGPGRSVPHPAPPPASTWQGAALEDPLLILVTFSSERALELRDLVTAEAALRELLGEPVRRIDVAAADSREAAELILTAIRADGSFAPFGVQVEGVLVP